MIGLGNCHQPIVANPLLPVHLFALDDSDQASLHSASRKRWLIHQQQYIDRVAIRCYRFGEKTKIVGKRHARGQYLFERKDFLFGIKGEFVPASLGSLNNHLKRSILLIERPQRGGICKTPRLLPGHFRSPLLTYDESRWLERSISLGFA